METINNSCVKGKRILLLYARFFGYDRIVKTQLEKLGAHVDLFDARANISTYEKAILKITPAFYIRKQIKFHEKIQNEKKETRYDFIFTNENLDKDILLGYKKVFPDAKLILYLDDSAKNLRHVEKTFQYYDKVMTFDRSDSQKYDIVFRPLFFNELLSSKVNIDVQEKYIICFIGTVHSDRLNVIDKLLCVNKMDNCFLYLYLQSPFMYFYYFLTNKVFRKYRKDDFEYNQLSMNDVAEKMLESKIILDIQHPQQTGLTMRTIETIGIGKKIITTNSDIKNYEFYNPNNIQIIDRNNPKIDETFFDMPFEPLSEEVYNKYSINGWIETVFN